MIRRRRAKSEEAELDITSFMNLMIVLVPVLLLGLVFSQVRILNLQLPAGAQPSADNDAPKVLELIITPAGLDVNYPAGVLLKTFKKTDKGYDFSALSKYLQDLKRTFQQKKIKKNDIVILLSPEIDYQTIVSAMDTVRSFKAVVVASVVDAELFPAISLGEAPELAIGTDVSNSVNSAKGGQ